MIGAMLGEWRWRRECAIGLVCRGISWWLAANRIALHAADLEGITYGASEINGLEGISMIDRG